MKKIIILSGILSSSLAFSQVGINTPNPQASLDIQSKGSTAATKALRINNSSNTEIITVTDAGRIGVGNSSPESSLHVVTTAQNGIISERATTSANGPYLALRKNNSVTPTTNGAVTSGNILGTISFAGNTGNGYEGDALNSNTGISAIATENFSTTRQGSDLRFYTVPNGAAVRATRLTISNNGNVGIGTTIPTNILDVRSATNGALKIVDGTQGNARVLTSDANGVGTWKDLPASADTNIYNSNGTLTGARTVAQGTNALAFTSTATAGTNHFSVDGSTFSVDAVNNRVGIGTTTPRNMLDLGTGNGKKLALWNSAAGDDFYGLGNAASVLQLFAGAPAAGDPLMTLNKNGRVGIGTTNPQANFHSIGTRRFENSTSGSVVAGSVLTATDTNGTAEWRTPASQTAVGGREAGAGINIPFANDGAFKYTGRYVILPPGKWAVTITQLAQTVGNLNNNDWMFVRSTFGEGNVAIGATLTQSGDVKGPSLMSFRVQGPASAGHAQQFAAFQGTVIIENTTSSDKTYRYIAGSTVIGGSPNNTTVLSRFGGTWAESSIFAIAIK